MEKKKGGKAELMFFIKMNGIGKDVDIGVLLRGILTEGECSIRLISKY
jgi:hypothetical protein